MSKAPRPVVFPCVIATRVDAATADALRQHAAKDGVAVGDIVRHLLVSFAGAAKPTPIRHRRIPDGAELARLLGELGRIGGNLQRAYVAATNKELAFDAQEFAAVRDELRAAAAEVRTLIGGPRDN